MNDRLLPLLKEEGLKKLNNATVAVVGIGGVGGICVEALARCGVGNIIVQDHDIIEESNINRQIVANYTTIGKYKVDVIENIIKNINPNCNVIKLNSFFDENNNDLFNYKIDYVVDAIDSFDSKCLLISECINRNINFISSMGAAKKLDPKLVNVIKINKTNTDPLAKKVRLRFKGCNFDVVSSSEISKCEMLGSYMPVVSTFGLLAANHVIINLIGE